MWEVRFTRSCLGGYCPAGDWRLRVYVDGVAYPGDPSTLPLATHQEVVVTFGTAAELPSPIPSVYRSPPGLWWNPAVPGSGVVTGIRIR